jgi:hypothetical protein
MNDNRLGGLALILGALSGIITLTFHPAGVGHHVTPAQFEVLIAVIIGVHILAIAGLPVSFAGALALTHRIDSPVHLATLGLIVYGFGAVAMMAAAAMSGLVIPSILRETAGHITAGDQAHTFLSYTHSINQAFAKIGAAAFCIAILLWSIVILKNRPLPLSLGVYGLVSSIAIVLAMIIGKLDTELHGFRIFTLAQAIWCIAAGVCLWRLSLTTQLERTAAGF